MPHFDWYLLRSGSERAAYLKRSVFQQGNRRGRIVSSPGKAESASLRRTQHAGGTIDSSLGKIQSAVDYNNPFASLDNIASADGRILPSLGNVPSSDSGIRSSLG